MRDTILLTENDYQLLSGLVEGGLTGGSSDRSVLKLLREELDRAEIVESHEVSPDVITMYSEVRLRDCDTGEERILRLAYPSQVRPPKDISVLAPIGIALLGYRVGDIVEWRMPRGVRRVEILEVMYQPEAAESGSIAAAV